jgi:aminoglycoside 6-adenylyltransferase
VVLLDKDGRIKTRPPTNEGDYLPKKPTAKAFNDCCNEFWWVCPYVAKGLWRREIIYARYMLDEIVRAQLMKMLQWYIGMHADFALNPGKYGKYYQRYLEPDLWELLLLTYAGGDYEPTWEAMESMCSLFRITASEVAKLFGFDYPESYDRGVSAHLEHIRNLPREAKEMY